jgi:uncharacterized glyoxalase superfamily protein PhnB
VILSRLFATLLLRSLLIQNHSHDRKDDCTLAIGHTQTTSLFGTDSVRPADNHTIIIEFRVEDVDSEYKRLKPLVIDWVQEPTTMPWGNRSILFRDPDGNLVNLFTPVTEEAIKKFSSSPRT